MGTDSPLSKPTPSRLLFSCLLGGLCWLAGWMLPSLIPSANKATLGDSKPEMVESGQLRPLPQMNPLPKTVWTSDRLRAWIEGTLGSGVAISDAIWSAAAEDQEILRREVWTILMADGRWEEALDACWNAPDFNDYSSRTTLIKQLARERPAEVADFMIGKVQSGALPYNALSSLTASWAAEDVPAAAGFLQKIQGDAPWAANLRLELVGELLTRQPAAVSEADLAACFDRVVDPAQLIHSLGQAFGHGDPKRALAWAQQLSSPVQRRAAIEAALSGAAAHQAEFWSALEMVSEPPLKTNAVRMWGANQAQQDSSAGIGAVMQIADPDLKAAALSGYFRAAAGKNGPSAAKAAIELFRSGRAEVSAVEAVFQACPDQARAALQNGSLPSAVVEAAIRMLAQSDK